MIRGGMLGYVVRTLVHRVRSEAALFLLTLASVAIGVASVVAIQLIHQSAIASFAAGMRAVDGDVDLSIVPDGPFLDDSAWRIAISDPGVEAALPILDFSVRVRPSSKGPEGSLRAKGLYLDVIATDLTLAQKIPYRGDAPNVRDLVAGANAIALTDTLAENLGLIPGDLLTVSLGSRTVDLVVAGLLDLRKRSLLVSDRLVVMDIGAAQDAFGRAGELDRIDLDLVPGANAAEVANRLLPRLPPSCRLLTPKQREAQAEGLLEAFRVNLTALSFVAVFVGLFLVFSAVRAQIVRRRAEFGVLRALGATRGAVLAAALSEVAMLAGLGCALGLPLGFEAARRNIAAVSATLTNLYLLDAIAGLHAPAWLVPLALLVGVGGALLAAAPPLFESVMADPRDLLSSRVVERRVDRHAPHLAILGIGACAVAFAAYRLGLLGTKPAGFILGFVVIASLPLLMPWVFTRALARSGVRGFGIGFAARALSRRVSSAAISAAALSIAVAMLFGITLMVGSFRDTVMHWIETTFRADVYVATETIGPSQGKAGIARDVVAAIAADPAVRLVDRQRRALLWFGERRVTVLGVESNHVESEMRFPLLKPRNGEEHAVAAELAAGGTAVISEPLALKSGLDVGDAIQLPGAKGQWTLRVRGVFHDYTSEHGIVVVDEKEFDRGLGPGDVNAMGIFLHPGQRVDEVMDRWRENLPKALAITPNERIRSEALRIFDQTFLVTRLLEATALAVASLGLALGLLILAAERRAEIALYRSLGATKRQVFLLFLGKGLAIGASGIAVGALGGVALALVLVAVINYAWFGWTIDLSFPALAMARQTGTILAAIVVASLYPSLLASRETGTELSREKE